MTPLVDGTYECCHGWMKLGWYPWQLLEQCLVYSASRQYCDERVGMDDQDLDEKSLSEILIEIGFTFSVGNITQALFSRYWAKTYRIVLLNTTFSVIIIDEPSWIWEISRISFTLPANFGESVEYTSNEWRTNPEITTCIWLDMETLGYRHTMLKSLPIHRWKHWMPCVAQTLSFSRTITTKTKVNDLETSLLRLITYGWKWKWKL